MSLVIHFLLTPLCVLSGTPPARVTTPRWSGPALPAWVAAWWPSTTRTRRLSSPGITCVTTGPGETRWDYLRLVSARKYWPLIGQLTAISLRWGTWCTDQGPRAPRVPGAQPAQADTRACAPAPAPEWASLMTIPWIVEDHLVPGRCGSLFLLTVWLLLTVRIIINSSINKDRRKGF